MARFHEKIKLAGNLLVLSQYSRPQYTGQIAYSRVSHPIDKKREVSGSGEKERDHRRQTVNRARTRFFDLVNLNFHSLDKFLTLTFANGLYTSQEIANPQFKNFIDLLRKTHDKDLKYIAAIEKQKRGVIHYHLLMQMKYLDFEILLEKWKLGGAWIKKIPTDVDSTSRYVGKYLAKDLAAAGAGTESMKYKKLFLRSQNLKYPPLVERGKRGQFSKGLRELLITAGFYGELQKEEVFESENEYLGKFKISTFSFRRGSTDVSGLKEEVLRYVDYCFASKRRNSPPNHPDGVDHRRRS